MIPNNEAPVSDSPLPSTVQDAIADCPQIRILVLGKTGCGKSSLINEVFGVGKNELAQVSPDRPGKADINKEFRHPSNDRFILHDSEGFEPGQDAKLNTVKTFIEDRSEIPPRDRLHVVWICISAPMANDRVIETGVQEIFEMTRKKRIPTIVVFTKYDQLVTTAMMEAGARSMNKKEKWQYGEVKADEAVENLCIRPWRETFGKVPLVVSTRSRYKNTIEKLIEATDKEIPRRGDVGSYTEAVPLNFAAAQRAHPAIKIDASIDIGKLKYWKALLSKTDFTGKKLRRCLDVIHDDIVAVWNIRDSHYLAGDDFKAKVMVLVDDLLVNPDTPTPSSGLTVAMVAALGVAVSSPAGIVILVVGLPVLIAKWLYDVYENTSHNIACVMAYIVDLTILMHRLSAIEISQERVISTLKDYAKSGEIAQVHNDIRSFSSHITSSRLGGEDHALNEIIRLIKKHRDQHH